MPLEARACLYLFSLYRAQLRRLQRNVLKSRDHLLVQLARILFLRWDLRPVCVVVERIGWGCCSFSDEVRPPEFALYLDMVPHFQIQGS